MCCNRMCLSNMAIRKVDGWYGEKAAVHIDGGVPSGAYEMAKQVVVRIFAIDLCLWAVMYPKMSSYVEDPEIRVESWEC